MYYKTNALDWNVAFAFFVNRFEKIHENSPNRVDIMVKFGQGNLVKIHLRLTPLIQNVALVLENICVKFDENSFNIIEAMAMSVFFKALKGR